MTMIAPELPTTEQLHTALPLEEAAVAHITEARLTTGSKMLQKIPGYIAVVGACGPTIRSLHTIRHEGRKIRRIDQATDGLTVEQRLAVWKPRSNPEDWHGIETTHPVEAYELITESANEGVKVAMEVASLAHIARYGNALSLMWSGSRNLGNLALLEEVSLAAPTIPLAVKNGLDGDVDQTLKIVDHLNELRSGVEEAAPVVLMYRGGTNAQNPAAWEYQYRRALSLTNGNMFADTAHGTEMAHDLRQQFGKSSDGQLAGLDHIVRLAEIGESPAGMIAEASDAPTDTDPHSPFGIIMESAIYINELRMNQ